MSIICLTFSLLLVGVAADVVEHPIKFTGAEFVKDTVTVGGHVYSVFEHEPHAHYTRRPSREWYPGLYEQYPLRFVTGLPQLIGLPRKRTFCDLFMLEAAMSQSARKHLGVSAASGMAPKHSGFGLFLKDETGREIGRISSSYWAISNTDQGVPKLTDAQDTVFFLNRALTTYTISKDSWEEGYWQTAKQINAEPIKFDEAYPKFEKLLTMFAQKYPMYSASELQHAKTDEVIASSVTCSTLPEHMIKGFTGRDTLQENLASIAVLILKVPDGQHFPVDQKVAAKVARGEDARFKVLQPAFYDKHHKLQALHEIPSQLYAFTLAGFYYRHNFNGGNVMPKSFNQYLATIQNYAKKASKQQNEQNKIALSKHILLGSMIPPKET